MSYERSPTPRTPALIVVLLDASASMAERLGDKPRIQIAVEATESLIHALVSIPTWGPKIKPAYRIAMLAYNDAIWDLLGGVEPIDAVAGIGPPALMPRGAKRTAHALARVESLIGDELPSLQDCPAPLVLHITDGENAATDPVPAAQRLMSIPVPDGSVLIANLIISDSVLPAPTMDPKVWAGITPDTTLHSQSAHRLRAMSSRLPEQYRIALEDQGYRLAAGAYMMLPASSREFIELAVRMASGPRSTGTVISPSAHVAGPTPAPQPPHLDENVQFTVYRPRTVRPATWYSLLAFAHLSERRPGTDEPDPIEEVRAQARHLLGSSVGEYQDVTQDSAEGIPWEGQITFVPSIPGVEFNPPSASFLWIESVHRQDFRLRARPELDGRVARGRLTVFLGRIILADISLAIRVDSGYQAPSRDAPLDAASARPYRRIFPSYSHRVSPLLRSSNATPGPWAMTSPVTSSACARERSGTTNWDSSSRTPMSSSCSGPGTPSGPHSSVRNGSTPFPWLGPTSSVRSIGKSRCRGQMRKGCLPLRSPRSTSIAWSPVRI